MLVRPGKRRLLCFHPEPGAGELSHWMSHVTQALMGGTHEGVSNELATTSRPQMRLTNEEALHTKITDYI